MATSTIVTNPALVAVLNASSQARDQAIALLDQISAQTQTPDLETQLSITKQQKLLYAYLAQLRGAHRDAVFGARETKAETTQARQEVDKLHLQLQNLYYEQRHLQGEITACDSYEYVTDSALAWCRAYQYMLIFFFFFSCSHKYLSLPLIPVEEFVTLYPEHANDDETALTIARIGHEHAEREALEQQRQGLLKKKQGLIADNKKRKDDLASLDKQLEAFIDVSSIL